MCLFPVKASIKKFVDTDTGEYRTIINFGAKANSLILQKKADPIDLPCGKCIECDLQRSNEWSYRIVNEASLYKDNCFITLTYRDNPIELNIRDYQLFLKRLRKKIGHFRYFLCGEYGSKKKRPHYHIIIFGWKPSDLEYFFTDKSGNIVYLSKEVESIWQNGFVSVGEVNLNTAKYVAKYMQKQVDYGDLKKPFIRMSLKPGIGYNYFIQNKQCLQTDKIYYDGNYIKLPRYYLKIASRNGFGDLEIKNNRVIKAQLCKRSEKELEDKRLFWSKKLDKPV